MKGPSMQPQGYRAHVAESRGADRRKGKYLTFQLGQEHYGIDILKVQEIRGYEAPRAIANAPDFIKGVINLRGVIVPILDLRVRFRLAHGAYDAFTVVIILQAASRVVGVVVDAVSDVLECDPDEIRATPELATATFDTRFITGLVTVEEGLLMLLDIEKLLTSADMALVDSVSN